MLQTFMSLGLLHKIGLISFVLFGLFFVVSGIVLYEQNHSLSELVMCVLAGPLLFAFCILDLLGSG